MNVPQKGYVPFLRDFSTNPDQYNMNIFYLDEDPSIAAVMHCDKHVIKMILETAQILSTTWHAVAGEHEGEKWTESLTLDWSKPTGDAPAGELEWLHSRLAGQRIYKPTHENHPSSQWARLYGGNYEWLYRLGCGLLEEYTYRYGKAHACTPVIRALELLPPPLLATVDTYCDPPAVMPHEYIVHDVVESYHRYYLGAKKDILHYTRRPPPRWCADVATFKEGV